MQLCQLHTCFFFLLFPLKSLIVYLNIYMLKFDIDTFYLGFIIFFGHNPKKRENAWCIKKTELNMKYRIDSFYAEARGLQKQHGCNIIM